MPHTTRPPIMDITEDIPGLAAYARTAVRLHPRRGNPTPDDSSIGGPLRWPADEPWPFCDQQHGRGGSPQAPVAMVPIAQVYAADVTAYPFPQGSDLLQILWCPNHDAYWPDETISVRWRRAADVTAVLADPPAPHMVEAEWLVPTPCVLDPEPITEYPYHEELPRELRDALEDWRTDYPAYQYGLSIASGCKLGGGMSWEVTDMGDPPTCGQCGAPAHLILQLDSSEWGGESDHDGGPPRWRPIEDADLDSGADDAYWAAKEPTGLEIGRYSHGGFFGCSADHRHPVTFHCQ
ncbi:MULTISPECIES: hypothetical protein [unclassified Spirillospora]|uniref:hypothetical protein n=1 Tax=unclassified Spirillospora TaxID=2642701 RepID=UPI00371FB6D3